jgi:hypothetical protein
MITPSTMQTVIVRFANSSISDIRLVVTSAPAASDSTTQDAQIAAQALTFSHNILALKHAIRTHLDDQYRNKGLRLIQAGRVLVDGDTIMLGLRLNARQEVGLDNADQERGKANNDRKGKNKAFVEPPPVYIHCVVSSEDVANDILVAEGVAAAVRHVQAPPAPTAVPSAGITNDNILPFSTRRTLPDFDVNGNSGPATSSTTQPHPPPQQQQPRGFNRLLTTGFTHQDVATLRAQFRAMTAARHTPDTMPDADALLRLEERWLDSEASSSTANANTANSGGAIAAGAGGAIVGTEEEDSPSAALNDMLLGIISGFFWPIGAVVWGLREEGVWSRRRGWAVLGGVAVNAAFGVIRGMG